MREYMIVEAASAAMLSKLVNEKLEEGYVLAGSHSATAGGYSQAVAKIPEMQTLVSELKQADSRTVVDGISDDAMGQLQSLFNPFHEILRH